MKLEQFIQFERNIFMILLELLYNEKINNKIIFIDSHLIIVHIWASINIFTN